MPATACAQLRVLFLTNQKDSEFDTLCRKCASSGPRDMPKMRQGRLRSKGHDDQRRGPEDGPSTQMKGFEGRARALT